VISVVPVPVAETTTIPDVPVATIVTVVEETTSTLTSLAEESTTTSVPESTTTSLPVPVNPVDVGDEDATSEEVPNIGVPVLPPPKVPPRNVTLERVLNQLTVQQRKLVVIAQKRADEATLRVAEATAALNELAAKQQVAAGEIAALKKQFADIKAKLRLRALSVLAGSEIDQIDTILNSQDTSEFVHNVDLVGVVQSEEAKLTDQYRSKIAEIDAKNAAIDALVAEKQLELDTIISEQQALGDALLKVQQQLASVTSGAAIALGGFVFPVGAPFNFVDTFGAPRMTGTKYAHTHEGTDIFAPQGTPLYAVSRGVVARVGVGVLGGNKLWVVGADGTSYYYAHLSAFAEGIQDGTFVEAGQVVGFVGNTGNALTTPAHCHFEIHPGGGPAVNPYPFLDAVRRTDVTALLRASQAAAATTVPATIPGEIRAGVGIVREIAIGVDTPAMGPTTTQLPGSAASKTTLPYRKVPTP
jgi:murein DD-endopeptidase MepM/ murein hydrolase activator NlpD